MEAMAERRPRPLAWMGRRLGAAAAVEDTAARAAADSVRDLIGRLELPSRLSQVGVPQADLPAIAEAAYPEGEEREMALQLLRRMW
jgi:alcohol dehydrogenase class IV